MKEPPAWKLFGPAIICASVKNEGVSEFVYGGQIWHDMVLRFHEN